MKKNLLLFVAMSLSISSQSLASAFSSEEMQKIEEQAYEALVNEAPRMSLTGDVRSEEKLTDLLKEVDDYATELENVLMVGGDIETDLKSSIQATSVTCSMKESRIAKCYLEVLYKLGDQAIEFDVLVDKDNKVLLTSKVAIVHRGT